MLGLLVSLSAVVHIFAVLQGQDTGPYMYRSFPCDGGVACKGTIRIELYPFGGDRVYEEMGVRHTAVTATNLAALVRICQE